MVVTHGPTALVHFSLHSSTVRSLAEITLAIVLFADAASVDMRARPPRPPSRRASSPSGSRSPSRPAPPRRRRSSAAAAWGGGRVGAIVAPTDAALGASIMEDGRVPAAVRRTLNVESGLNDGIATPFINVFIAGAVTEDALGGTHLASAFIELGGGALIGLGVGVVGATLLVLSRHGWSAPASGRWRSWPSPSAYSTAVAAGTNGFVAAFVAGIAFGTADRHNDEAMVLFTEEAGTLLSLLVWFVFGAVMLVPGLEDAGWRTGVRPPRAHRPAHGAGRLGTGGLEARSGDRSLHRLVRARGLASVVFGLIAVDALEPAQSKVVLAAVMLTVALSVLLHGVSASPLGVAIWGVLRLPSGATQARARAGEPTRHARAAPSGARRSPGATVPRTTPSRADPAPRPQSSYQLTNGSSTKDPEPSAGVARIDARSQRVYK